MAPASTVKILLCRITQGTGPTLLKPEQTKTFAIQPQRLSLNMAWLVIIFQEFFKFFIIEHLIFRSPCLHHKGSLVFILSYVVVSIYDYLAESHKPKMVHPYLTTQPTSTYRTLIYSCRAIRITNYIGEQSGLSQASASASYPAVDAVFNIFVQHGSVGN